MPYLGCDVLVAGGGLGGVAAALAIAENGHSVILCEETDWVGGQLTSQGVPPDEHPWIETFGCTNRYRKLRNELRQIYLSEPDFTGEGQFNPGSGWVSKITARPDYWHRAIRRLIDPLIESDKLRLFTRTILSGGSQLSGFVDESKVEPVEVDGDVIRSVCLFHLGSQTTTRVEATYYLDATELGDLLSLSGAEWVTGAESKLVTGEDHAPDIGSAGNQQAVTWVFAMGFDPEADHLIEKPKDYDFWKKFEPEFWPSPLFNLQDLDPTSNLPREPALPLFAEDWRSWFKYRQIVDPTLYSPPRDFPTTIVNWPQNDYFLGELIHASPTLRWQRLCEAKEQSRCLLYWMQTECPRPEGGYGYPGLFVRPEFMGSPDGFALTPYVRESRRLVALESIIESQVSEARSPGRDLPPDVPNSVGIGSYRIDLHPSTEGDAYIDLATLPFQIPLGSLIPIRTKNLVAACKNIGSTHITNGCYRLHPVEWNIGEAAGLLAGFCLKQKCNPHQVFGEAALTENFLSHLSDEGVETRWPLDG